MAGSFVKDDGAASPRLVVAREPVGPNNTTDKNKKSVGDQAVNDALLIIGIAWAVLLFLWFSLRRYNV